MRIDAEFFRRTTGLVTGGAGRVPEGGAVPLPADLRWFPLLGVVAGVLAAGFFLPLGAGLLPMDVAVVLTMLWQAAICGFRAESAFFEAGGGVAGGGADAGRRVALLVLLLVLKFLLIRQFFPGEAMRVFVVSGVTMYCVPVMCSRSGAVGGDGLADRVGMGVVTLSWVVWLGALLWLSAPEVFVGRADARGARSALIVAAAGLFGWLLMLDGKRRHRAAAPVWGHDIFCGSLASECALLAALFAARHSLP